jgi:Tfp pilus assembly protein PilO
LLSSFELNETDEEELKVTLQKKFQEAAELLKEIKEF